MPARSSRSLIVFLARGDGLMLGSRTLELDGRSPSAALSVTRLEWSEQALSALERLVLTHSLPPDTRDRIEASAQPLRRFPLIGPEIRAVADGSLRFLIGPWPWLVIVYLYIETDERAVIVSVEDGRAATSTIARER